MTYVEIPPDKPDVTNYSEEEKGADDDEDSDDAPDPLLAEDDKLYEIDVDDFNNNFGLPATSVYQASTMTPNNALKNTLAQNLGGTVLSDGGA